MANELPRKQFGSVRREPAPDTPIPVRRKKSEKKPTKRHLEQRLDNAKKDLKKFQDWKANGMAAWMIDDLIKWAKKRIADNEAGIAKFA